MSLTKFLKRIFLIATVAGFATGCSGTADDLLNPNYIPGPQLGERSNTPILEGGAGKGEKGDNARHALEVLGSYKRAHDPEPYYPVRQAPVVRKMWIPEHLNRSGDLIPAHYYFLEVLPSRWAVQDAFEIEKQLESESQSGAQVPWVYGNTK